MTHTLKIKSDNWNDKPELVSQHMTEQKWHPTVHYLENVDQVLFIAAGKDAMTDFIFHKND